MAQSALRQVFPRLSVLRHSFVNTSIRSSLSSIHTSSFEASISRLRRSSPRCFPRFPVTGKDLMHWRIFMVFPEDEKLTPEEAFRIYGETCAKGLNVSLEEAKKRIYACNVSANSRKLHFALQAVMTEKEWEKLPDPPNTYRGFQAVMTEEESEKFHDLPGVAVVLPDRYMDRDGRDYGGEYRFSNGKIITEPPPVYWSSVRAELEERLKMLREKRINSYVVGFCKIGDGCKGQWEVGGAKKMHGKLGVPIKCLI